MDEDDEELARLLPPTSRHNSPARPHTATTRRESPGRRSSCSRQPSPVRQQRKYPEQKENISSSQHNTRQSYSTVQEFRIDEKLSNLACHTKHKKFAGERIRIKNSKFALSKDASYNNDLNRLLSDELPNMNESDKKGINELSFVSMAQSGSDVNEIRRGLQIQNPNNNYDKSPNINSSYQSTSLQTFRRPIAHGHSNNYGVEGLVHHREDMSTLLSGELKDAHYPDLRTDNYLQLQNSSCQENYEWRVDAEVVWAQQMAACKINRNEKNINNKNSHSEIVPHPEMKVLNRHKKVSETTSSYTAKFTKRKKSDLMPSNSVLVPLPNSGGSCTNYPPSRLFGAHLIGDTPHPCQDESGAYPCQELPNPGVHDSGEVKTDAILNNVPRPLGFDYRLNPYYEYPIGIYISTNSENCTASLVSSVQSDTSRDLSSHCSEPSPQSQDWVSSSSDEFPWRSPVPPQLHHKNKSKHKGDTIWMNSGDEVSDCTIGGLDSDLEVDGTLTACSLRPLCSSVGEINSSIKESNTESSLHAMTNTSTRAALGSSSPTPCVIPRGEREECEGPLLDGHKCVDEESVNSYITSAPSSVCTPCKSAYSSPSSNKSLSRETVNCSSCDTVLQQPTKINRGSQVDLCVSEVETECEGLGSLEREACPQYSRVLFEHFIRIFCISLLG